MEKTAIFGFNCKSFRTQSFLAVKQPVVKYIDKIFDVLDDEILKSHA
ncbi:23872_t:CDS:2 [Dentiscutata erythropus]|uniref:23872_t:CDS:1 n=1 Tax=Dentiscutata erythropus TaxID=1348616 RepID=A0A9N9H941_9GLOM|nr:23872_t:CDS:2 [Dentiscutata erythropus]